MYLYICEGYKEKGSTEELVRKSLALFVREKGLDIGKSSGEILRTEKGKPYFKEIPVSFSVSHTGDTWVCLMTDGNDPVGVDIQTIKTYSYEKIAGKYYTEAEQEYCKDNGADGFFKIWTRKEAYAKYTGLGIGKYLAETDTLNNSRVTFTEIEAGDSIRGACCTKWKGQLWIRKI